MPKKKPASERKRAANGQGSINQRADGRYKIDVSLGYNPTTGKAIRKSVYGWTQDEALAKAQKLKVSANDGVFTEPSRLTVGQWLDIWHNEYLGNVKPDTSSQYETYIRVHIKPNLDRIKLTALSPHAIQSVYNGLQRETDTQKPLSAKSIRNLHGILHAALEKAVLLGYIQRNPTKGCTLPRVAKKEMTVIKDDDVTRFLNAVKGHQYESIYLMDMFTGLREGEILGLTWNCVNFTNGTIIVKQQLKKERKKNARYYFAPLKTDKVRTLTASRHVMNLLHQQRTRQMEWQLRAGGAFDNDMNLVFTTELGRHLVAFTVYRNLKEIVHKLGLDAVRFHDLRHTFALFSLQNGDDIKTLQENMGHANISTTLDVYGHVSEKMKKDSASRMDAFIDSLTHR
jgi:integrase